MKNLNICLGFIAAFLLLACAPLFSAGTAADDASFAGFVQPNGEKSFVAFPEYPTARAWRYLHDDDVDLHSTAKGVGPDSGMVIFTEKGENPGEVMFYDVGARGEDLKKYKGISFWMRGDGGSGNLSLGTNWNQKVASYARMGKFPLSQKAWKKYFVPWKSFTPDVSEKGFYFINAKLEPAAPRQAWAVIARLNFYSEQVSEKIEDRKADDPPGMIPAEQFVSGADKLIPKVLTKLKAGKPLTIVCAGDSITAGAQMTYKPNKAPNRDYDAYVYFAVLQKKLAEYYKYKKARYAMKMWQSVDKKTGKTASGAAADGFAVVTPGFSEAALAGFDGLQVISVGAGGKNTQFGADHISDVTMFNPDLVIWFYGVNDTLSKGLNAYTSNTERAIKALQDKKMEVILAGPTFFLGKGYFENGIAFREPARELASNLNVPFVDQSGAFTARGKRYIGDLLSDGVHPNEYGHKMLATTLAAALGVPGQFVWDQPLFLAVKNGAKPGN